ncbi:hypothetical protein F4604DRAFT_1715250 [Suillus subluteus]|nr:hypothetical protein F4604DRAFT_1715250 [Suillus subluteus]
MLRLDLRHSLLQFLNFASITASALILWKGLGLILNTESPIVVVLSGSMEPAFYRGDILFLTNPPRKPYHTGDITVYNIPGAEIPIVHRVMETRDVFIPFHNSTQNPIIKLAKLNLPPGEHQLMLTKGDNNHVDDIDLYQGLEWLDQRHIVGKVRGYVFSHFM